MLFLPGMPSALIWPYEWIIIGLWSLVGLVFVLRVPRVSAGPDAEERCSPLPAGSGSSPRGPGGYTGSSRGSTRISLTATCSGWRSA